MNEKVASHDFGVHSIPVSWVSSPEPAYRTRVAEQGNIDLIVQSLSQYGSVAENVEVVLFWPPNAAKPKKDAFSVNAVEVKAFVDQKQGFFAVVGDHRTLATQYLSKKYPNNKKWQNINARVFICSRDSENYQWLKSWGIIDNIKGQKRISLSFKDKVCAIHADFLELEDHRGEPMIAQITHDVKSARMNDFGITSNTFGSLWQVAAKTGKVWDLLSQLLAGDIKKGQGKSLPKPIKSTSMIAGMGGLEDSDLALILQEVIDGTLDIGKFNQRCAQFKATIKVQTAVLNELDLSDWCVAMTSHPHSTSVDFAARWVTYLVQKQTKARDPLPQNFFDELEQRKKMDARGQDARKVRSCSATRRALIININAAVQTVDVNLAERTFEIQLSATLVKVFLQDALAMSSTKDLKGQYGKISFFSRLALVLHY